MRVCVFAWNMCMDVCICMWDTRLRCVGHDHTLHAHTVSSSTLFRERTQCRRLCRSRRKSPMPAQPHGTWMRRSHQVECAFVLRCTRLCRMRCIGSCTGCVYILLRPGFHGNSNSPAHHVLPLCRTQEKTTQIHRTRPTWQSLPADMTSPCEIGAAKRSLDV